MGLSRLLSTALFAYALQATAPQALAEAEARNPYIQYYLKQGTLNYSKPEWQKLKKGMQFTTIEVKKRFKEGGESLVDKVAMVKINPEFYHFKVIDNFTGRGYNARTIEEWQKETKALVVLNGPFYCHFCVKKERRRHKKEILYQDLRHNIKYWAVDINEAKQGNCPEKKERVLYNAPCGTILVDGKIIKSKEYEMMFVAEPKKEGLPKAKILNLKKDKQDFALWKEGIQTFPLLVDKGKNCQKRKYNWQANRTGIAEDKEGNILVFRTEGGYFTFYDLGTFLEKSGLGIEKAVSLDGGYESEIAIKIEREGVFEEDFEYTRYGQWETQGPKRDISIIGARFVIPRVIGVFPRKTQKLVEIDPPMEIIGKIKKEHRKIKKGKR